MYCRYLEECDSYHLYGEAGNDVIFGQVGNDTIYGGSGNDSITGFTARKT
jgi:Ca2+-binding RTX toxin-like protein